MGPAKETEYLTALEIAVKLRTSFRVAHRIFDAMGLKPDKRERALNFTRFLYRTERLKEVKEYLKANPRKPGPKGPRKFRNTNPIH